MVYVPDPNCTCGRLRRAARVASRLYDRHLAEAGLNVSQYGMLTTINKMQDGSISDLADALEMDRTTLTRNLAPLERCGYLAIGAGLDRRSKAVTLTAAGREKYDEARPMWLKAQAEVDAALGDGTKKRLHEELDRSIVELKK